MAKHSRKMGKRWIWITAIAAVGVLVLAAAAVSALALTYKTVYPSLTVAGVPLGGLSVDEAQQVLEEQFADFGKEKSVSFARGSDVQALAMENHAWVNAGETAQSAYDYGRKENILQRVLLWLPYEKEIPLVVETDDTYINEAIDDMASSWENLEQYITIHREEEEVEVTIPDGVQVIDRAATVDSLEAALSKNQFGEIAVPTTALSDANLLHNVICREPKDATISTAEDGKTVWVEEEEGISVSLSDLEQALETGENHFTVPAVFTPAEIDLETLKQRSFADVLGEYASPYDAGQVDRTVNVRLAVEAINGSVLAPGAVFSYNSALGERTVAKGYRNARIFVAGRVEDGLAGGICQTSSTLHAAVLYADLEIVKRTNHQFAVAYMPNGMDATVAWGSLDYVFRNNQKYPVKINAYLTGNRVVVQILGTKTDDTEVKIRNEQIGSRDFTEEIETDPTLAPGTRIVDQAGQRGATVNTYKIYKTPGQPDREVFLYRSVYTPMTRIVRVSPQDAPPEPEETAGPEATQTLLPTEPPLPDESAAPEASASPAPSTVPAETERPRPTPTPTPEPLTEPDPSPEVTPEASAEVTPEASTEPTE